MLLSWVAAIAMQTAIPQPSATPKETVIGWVSLRYGRTNGRSGPGKDYAVVWEYHERGLPMAVLRRSTEWTRVRDFQGDVMWMKNTVLRDRATALVTAGEPVALKSPKRHSHKTLARIAPGVLVRVLACTRELCTVRVAETEGMVDRDRLWGNVNVPATE